MLLSGLDLEDWSHLTANNIKAGRFRESTDDPANEIYQLFSA